MSCCSAAEMPATLATFILTSSMVSLPATVSEKGDPFPLTNSCILVLLQNQVNLFTNVKPFISNRTASWHNAGCVTRRCASTADML